MAQAARNVTAGTVAIFGLGLASSALAAVATDPPCCSSGDHGVHGSAITTSALGQASPGAVNYSRSPAWQAFVFNRSGLNYVELADASGVPRAAFAVLSDVLLQLPIGTDAIQQVGVAPQAASVVFEDASVVVGVSTATDGSTVWQVYVK